MINLLPFWVIGNEGGFFPELQTPMTALQMGPGERYDVVVDFSGKRGCRGLGGGRGSGMRRGVWLQEAKLQSSMPALGSRTIA